MISARPPILCERVRGSVIGWERGAQWFTDRPLEPGPHSHPGATEVFVVLAGTFVLSVGRTEVALHAGDVALVPPDLVHEPLGTDGTDLELVSIVSPNHREERFKTGGFTPSAFEGALEQWRPGGPFDLSDRHVDCRKHVLVAGETLSSAGRAGIDRVLVVVEGEADVEVGELGGRLGAGSMVFVAAQTPHSLIARGTGPTVVASVWAAGAEAALS